MAQNNDDGNSSVESLINNEVFVMDDEAHKSKVAIYPIKKLVLEVKTKELQP